MPSVCSACAPRVSGVGPARSAHLWRPSGVYIHASSSAHIFVHAQKSPRTPNDARVAHGDAHPANDDWPKWLLFFSARAVRVIFSLRFFRAVPRGGSFRVTNLLGYS